MYACVHYMQQNTNHLTNLWNWWLLGQHNSSEDNTPEEFPYFLLFKLSWSEWSQSWLYELKEVCKRYQPLQHNITVFFTIFMWCYLSIVINFRNYWFIILKCIHTRLYLKIYTRLTKHKLNIRLNNISFVF